MRDQRGTEMCSRSPEVPFPAANISHVFVGQTLWGSGTLYAKELRIMDGPRTGFAFRTHTIILSVAGAVGDACCGAAAWADGSGGAARANVRRDGRGSLRSSISAARRDGRGMVLHSSD